jgi:hypothetical protein
MALVAVLFMVIVPVLAATHRINTTSVDAISNITDIRFSNVTNSWGGSGNNTTAPPNWGQLIYQDISVFPDYLGPELGWVLLFSIPFIMMWISHADMTVPGFLGILLGLFVFGYIGSQYTFVAIGFMAIGITAMVWSISQKVR